MADAGVVFEAGGDWHVARAVAPGAAPDHPQAGTADVSGRATVPNTGGWERYQWVGAPRIRLPAGSHVLRVVSEQQYFNFDSVRVTLDTAGLSSTEPKPTESREPDRRTASVRPTARAPH